MDDDFEDFDADDVGTPNPELDDLGFIDEDVTPARKRRKDYEVEHKIIPGTELTRKVKHDIHEVTSILNVNTGMAFALLVTYHWKQERLLEEYYENETGVLVKAGVAVRHPVVPAAIVGPVTGFECAICCDDDPALEVVTLMCGHQACLRCYTSYVNTKLATETDCRLRCIERKCDLIVPEDIILRCASPAMNNRCVGLHWKTASLVRAHSRHCWPPVGGPAGAGCAGTTASSLTSTCATTCTTSGARHRGASGRWSATSVRHSSTASCPPSSAIAATPSALGTLQHARAIRRLRRPWWLIDSRSPPVATQCSRRRCRCGNQDHMPATCTIAKRWLKKCADDSETANWISAHTKECPKCHATIEKNGGCNHMTCKVGHLGQGAADWHTPSLTPSTFFILLYCDLQKCKYEFCWVCQGPWTEHGSSWYQCNRFDEKKKDPKVTGTVRHSFFLRH